MILYLDSSAIVKQYVAEAGSVETHKAVAESEMNGTAVVSRAEVTAALREAVRVGAIAERDGKAAVGSFHRSWPALVRTRITEKLIRHASDLAWPTTSADMILFILHQQQHGSKRSDTVSRSPHLTNHYGVRPNRLG